jgi:hypothetical protein
MFFPLVNLPPQKICDTFVILEKMPKKCVWRNEFPMKIAALLTIIHFYVTFLVQKKVNVTLNFCSTIHARVRRRRWKPTCLPGNGGRRAELRMLP